MVSHKVFKCTLLYLPLFILKGEKRDITVHSTAHLMLIKFPPFLSSMKHQPKQATFTYKS